MLAHCFLDRRLVNGWNKISIAAKKANSKLPDAGKILRINIPSITSLSKFDDVLIAKIGTEQFDNFLEKLIKANPRCSTCGDAGDVLVGNLDKVLDDFYEVVTSKALKSDGSFVDGFGAFLAEAGEQASKAKGAALTLKKMANNMDEILEGGYSLKRFEGNIPDIETGHKLDLLLEKIDGDEIIQKSIEMKNWKQAYSIVEDTYEQFKAYLVSGKEFDYYFSDGLQDAMKVKFQNVFKNSAKAEELFNANPTYFINQNITNATVLNTLALQGSLVSHPFMNFVK